MTYDLSLMYLMGPGDFEKDEQKAGEWTRKAADMGHTEAMISMGTFHRFGHTGIKKSAKKAEKWYLKAANTGSADAQYLLAEWYMEEGNGGQKKAEEWYRKAAEQGHKDAQGKMDGFRRDEM